MNRGGRENKPLDSQDVPDKRPTSRSFGTIVGDGLCSEQRLMLAILVDAINILKRRIGTNGRSNRQDFAEAAHWIAIRGTHYLFTFESICDALNLPAEMLREHLGGSARGRRKASRIGEGRLRRQRTGRTFTMTVNPARSQVRSVGTAAEQVLRSPVWFRWSSQSSFSSRAFGVRTSPAHIALLRRRGKGIPRRV